MFIAILLAMASLGNTGWFLIFTIFQLLVGLIQFITALILLVFHYRLRVLYFYLVGSTALLACIGMIIEYRVDHYVFMVVAFGLPWILAVFLWHISFKLYKSKK